MSIDLGNYVKDAVDSSSGILDNYNILEDATSIAEQYAAAAGVAEYGTEAATTIGVIATTISGTLLLAVALVLIVILLFCRQIQHFLTNTLGSLPLGIGPKMHGLINTAFHPVDMFHDWVIGLVVHAASSLIHNFVVAVSHAILMPTSSAISNLDAAINHRVEPVHREVDHLWSWVSQINRWVENIANEIHGLRTGQHPIPQEIYDQIHELQRQQLLQAHAMVSIESQVSAVQATVAGLANSFTSLSTKVHGARAVNSGWQDIERELVDLKQSIERMIPQLQHDIATNTHSIAGLSPLSVLVSAGPRGIDNLRKLEDNPCQCPKVPNIGNEIGTAIALMEFIENG